METATYRSFVVRVWGRPGVATRVLVEEVRSGRRTELRGVDATQLAGCLERWLVPMNELQHPEGESRRDESPLPTGDKGG